jgi:nicotinamide riboside transporter PnuC
MQESVRRAEKATNLLLGSFLVAVGIICLLLNFSLLPVIGTVIGIPCVGFGIFFLARHKRTSRSSNQP